MKPITVIFDSEMAGTACVIHAEIQPYDPGGFYCPPTPAEVDITVLDANYQPWPELEAQLSRDDIKRIETEAFEFERENRELV